jgi:chromosome segregation ATPase
MNEIKQNYLSLAEDLILYIYSLKQYCERHKKGSESHEQGIKSLKINLMLIGPHLDNLLALEELKDHHDNLNVMKEEYFDLRQKLDNIKSNLGSVLSYKYG